MLSVHFPEAATPTRPDASRVPVARHGAPIDNAQNIVYPGMVLRPGISHPPSVSESPNAPPLVFSPSVPNGYDAGGGYYDSNFQGHNMYLQAGFIPPVENSALPIHQAGPPVDCYPFLDMLLGSDPPGPLPLLNCAQHQQPVANPACYQHKCTHVETLSEFVAKYPNAQFPEQIGANVIDPAALPRQETGQYTEQSSSLNITYDLPSASPSILAIPTGKCRWSEDEVCTAMRGDRQPCSNDIPKNTRRPRKKKKKACDDGEFICRICVILGRPLRQLSRKDALKRHIATVHALFIALFGNEALGILKPRQSRDEDLQPLIMACINLQRQARTHGDEIRQRQDLAFLHPHIAALMPNVS